MRQRPIWFSPTLSTSDNLVHDEAYYDLLLALRHSARRRRRPLGVQHGRDHRTSAQAHDGDGAAAQVHHSAQVVGVRGTRVRPSALDLADLLGLDAVLLVAQDERRYFFRLCGPGRCHRRRHVYLSSRLPPRFRRLNPPPTAADF